MNFKKYKFSFFLITLSIAEIVYLIFLNYNLAQRYLSADGKTRALFGIIELTWLVYKFYLAPFLIVSLILLILSFRKKEWKTLSIVAALLNVVSIVIVFVRFWTLMI